MTQNDAITSFAGCQLPKTSQHHNVLCWE